MATPGQPTLYRSEYCELAYDHCLLGATNRHAPCRRVSWSPPFG
jgi:hypothetical protein